MDEDAKKTALRMIPYGMYVLTSKSKDGKDVSAATVNWLTQTSFAPPLVAVGVKGDSGAHAHITDTGVFAVNVIGKEQLDTAFTFFKSLERDGDSIGGQAFVAGPETGCALLTDSPAWWECKVVGQLDQGDHTLFLGEVLEAGTRAEDQTILMRDHNLNYGG
ncbi:MAG: flavin reductase family protein [Chloroflexota bacterium]|uniref:Flavin reductase like domain-containing protein n=1 Tax=marine metagenome TaxID=408172 RepID=A0A381NLT8_9ZZZZ|nr:flavin reductase family protein [Chloroflexota bacterium]